VPQSGSIIRSFLVLETEEAHYAIGLLLLSDQQATSHQRGGLLNPPRVRRIIRYGSASSFVTLQEDQP
jgi:hypothetical protein